MIAVALIAFVALSGVSADPWSEGIADKFEQYTKKFNRNYEPAEYKLRKQIFTENSFFVEKHNAKAAAGDYSFTLSMDGPFADMNNKEYRSTVLGVKGSNFMHGASDTFDPSTVEDTPDSWDWRTQDNIVGDVKNQGQCGSCWAFSAVASMEGAYNQKTKKINSFSEQQLVDCVNNGANTCTVGGEMYQGIEDVVSRGGVETESDYPYTGTSGGGCKFTKSKVAATFSGYTNITSGDENALKEAAYAKPIISVGIDASSIWFQLYMGGVFDLSSCKNDANDLDHGVAVVGYGTNSGKDFFWVRNSWGATWGLKGYIMMSRNKDNQCGIATQACFANL